MIVRGEGPIPCHIMLIGEAPGEEEARSGRPFVGKAGRELDRILLSSGLSRDNVYVTNLVKTHPPGNRDPKPWEIERDGPDLVDEIGRVSPSVIGTIGRISTEFLLGPTDMASSHGKSFELGQYKIVPIYHPAAGLHDSDMMQLVEDDIRSFVRVVRGEDVNVYDGITPRYHEATDGMAVFLDAYESRLEGDVIAVDTEGDPYCLSFSLTPGSGYTIKSTQDRMLSWFGSQLDGKKVVFHNAVHDLIVLDKMGIHPTDFTDTMLMAHLLCTEPMGLKPLAKRLCGMEMQSYANVVSETANKGALEYLRRVGSVDWGPPLKPRSWNLNRRIESALRNENPRKVWSRIRDDMPELVAVVESEMGPMPDLCLDEVPGFSKYACRDADATLRVYNVLKPRIESLGLGRV